MNPKMKKTFSLVRISRMVSPFRSCRQRPSISPASPPIIRQLPLPSYPPSGRSLNLMSLSPPPPPRPSPARHQKVAVEVAKSGCGSCLCAPLRRRKKKRSPLRLTSAPAVDYGEDDLSRVRETPAYLWRKEEKWHMVSHEERRGGQVDRSVEKKEEEDDDGDGDDLFPSEFNKVAATRRKREVEIRRKQRRQKPSRKSKPRQSTSSANWVSTYQEEDEENDERSDDNNSSPDDTSTLLSCRSLSTASVNGRCTTLSPEPMPVARMLSRMVGCIGSGTGEGKVVKESFAVVKQSDDPRADFRRSMAEMVVEKGIFNAADLGQLLHCFMSLNSRHHHEAIAAAFADIWEALFPESAPRLIY